MGKAHDVPLSIRRSQSSRPSIRGAAALIRGAASRAMPLQGFIRSARSGSLMRAARARLLVPLHCAIGSWMRRAIIDVLKAASALGSAHRRSKPLEHDDGATSALVTRCHIHVSVNDTLVEAGAVDQEFPAEGRPERAAAWRARNCEGDFRGQSVDQRDARFRSPIQAQHHRQAARQGGQAVVEGACADGAPQRFFVVGAACQPRAQRPCRARSRRFT